MNFLFERVGKLEKLPYYKGLEVNLNKYQLCFGPDCHKFSNDLPSKRIYLLLWALIRGKGGCVPVDFLKKWLFENDPIDLKDKSKVVLLTNLVVEANNILHRISGGNFCIYFQRGRGYYLDYKGGENK